MEGGKQFYFLGLRSVVKWNEHFTESAIFPLRQCCIYKVGNPLVESSGFYIEVID